MTNHNLSTWFGLSYASFLVMPRVAMELMPDEWQEKMAELLHEYDATIKTDAFDVHSCYVSVKGKNNRFMKMPEELTNYRRPTPETKVELLK